jgi:predicted amidophosphoribosyltransferase
MLFTASCAGCNQPGDTLCRRCRFSLASTSSQVGDGGVLAALPFEGVARQVVLGLKYRNRRAVARQLAQLLVRRLPIGTVDVVTWAPTSAARARERGFDQAELLARAVARQLGVPCRRLLYRTHGGPQTGHTRAERLQGPVFRAHAGRRGPRVLLVDDVVTTGATLSSAREALLGAGVVDVVCAAAAATPAAHSVRPAQRRTTATAGSGSSSTTTASMPTASAAATLEATSSRKAVRPASVPSLARAS